MTKEISNEDFNNLEELLNDKELRELSLLVNKFNPFRVLKTQHYEIRHSNFLSWIMAPYESHNLDDKFLLEFFNNDIFNRNIKNIKDAEIRREYKDIDLLIISKSNNFVCAIENKIWSNEHDDQLHKYKNIVENEFDKFEKEYIFLTVDGKSASNSAYKNISYKQIKNILENIKEHSQNDIKNFIEQYISVLNNDIFEEDNKEILDLSNNLSCKYTKILNKIFTNAINIKNILNNSKIVDLYQRYYPAIEKITNIQRKIKENRDEKIKNALITFYKDDKIKMHSNWAFTAKMDKNSEYSFSQIDYTALPFENIKIQFYCGITTNKSYNLRELLTNNKNLINNLNNLPQNWSYNFCFRLLKKGSFHFTEKFIPEIVIKKDNIIDIINSLREIKIGQNKIKDVINFIKKERNNINESIDIDNKVLHQLEEYNKYKENVIFLPCLYLFYNTPYYDANYEFINDDLKGKTLEGIEILNMDKKKFRETYYQ